MAGDGAPALSRLSGGWATTGFTLLLALAGGAVAAWAGLPAAWLAGSMICVAAAALGGVPIGVPRRVRDVAFVLVGAGMGTAVTPETLDQVLRWPLSMAILAGSVIATIFVGTRHLERHRRWNHPTARFASVPGALTSVLVLAASSQADLPRVAFAQSVRLVVLVALIPALAGFVEPGSLPQAATVERPPPAEPGQLVLLLIACAAGAWLLIRCRVPGGALLGSMLASAVLHGSGVVVGSLPMPVLISGFVITGAVIGERFRGTPAPVIAASLRGAIESCVLAILVAGAFSALGAFLLGLPFPLVFLALAPGGLEAMAILAFLLQLDPAFVGAHHVARFLCLSLFPWLWMPRSKSSDGNR